VDHEVPLLAVTCVDPVGRDVVVSALLCDVDDAVVVQHDVTASPGPVLTRIVHDATGVRERSVPLEVGDCVGCALRDDLVAAITTLTTGPRPPAAIVAALPVAASAAPVLAALTPARAPSRVVPAGVIAAVAGDTLEQDLLGDDLLAERSLAHGPLDRRAVGEVLAAQLDVADAVALTTPARARAARLLAHLTAPGTPVALSERLPTGPLRATLAGT